MKPTLHDTLSRQLQPLEASDGERYRFYCCGPTVYGPAHIGNFRTFLVQDVFRRLCEACDLKPLHVRNLTDVDDKTIRGAREAGQALRTFTEGWTERFHADCEALNMLAPHHEPRATEHIDEQIRMVEELIAHNHAYVGGDGSVYFRVSSYDDYGCLSQLDKRELETQEENSGEARNLADEYDREQVRDFALWKAHKEEDGENKWDSPWGPGRPGWHLECSAMSLAYLGPTFDLHGGGVDLTFPHHENEIAQSCCSNHTETYARHWFHSAHLQVEGEKMSKSLGNLYTLEDLDKRGFQAMAVRWCLIGGHYRQPLNFTFNGLNAARSALRKLEREVGRVLEAEKLEAEAFSAMIAPPEPGFFEPEDAPFRNAWRHLLEDLNTPASIGALFEAMPFDAAHLNEPKRFLRALGSILYVLGIRLFDEAEQEEAPEAVQAMAKARWEAKAARDWAEADRLRDAIQAEGWAVRDSKDGYELEKNPS